MTATASRSTDAGRLDQSLIRALEGQVRGPVLSPSTPAYDDARSIWNGMIDRHPAVIVRCLGVGDVVACVRFAGEHQLPVCIKGGGHNIAGLAVADGAVMLDMSLMRGAWVDARARVAHAQAGCLLGDIDRETQLHGLAAVLGFVSNTGAAGLTLGGGMGYLTRRFGWTCDNVRSIEVVTADGRIVTASERENPDLFWGLCGGGGNFGVATRFEYALHPVGPEITGGAVAWRAEEAPEVLELYRELVESAPRELACVAGLRWAPPAPWLPAAIHGKPIVALFVCHTGSADDGERLAARLKGFRRPVGDVLQRRSYVSQQSIIDTANPKGRRYYWKSDYVSGVTDEMIARVIDHGERNPSPSSALLLFPLDGAINEIPTDRSAVGNRDARLVFNFAASWERPDEDPVHIAWARDGWSDLQQFSTGGTYVNFLTEDEGDDRIHRAYGANYDRLVEIKTRWDPTNLFRANKNIAPGRKAGLD